MTASTYSRRRAAVSRCSSGISCAPQERRNDADRQFRRKSLNDPQQLQLVVKRQAITGFHFDSANAKGRESPESRTGQLEELRFIARANIAHRRVNAASPAGDLHVVHAGGSHLMFGKPRRAEHAVRVRVDERRRQDSAATVDVRRIAKLRPEVLLSSDSDDPIAADGDRGASQYFQRAHLDATPSAWTAGAGDDLRRVDEQQLVRG